MLTHDHRSLKCFVKGSITLSAAGPNTPNTNTSFYSAISPFISGSSILLKASTFVTFGSVNTRSDCFYLQIQIDYCMFSLNSFLLSIFASFLGYFFFCFLEGALATFSNLRFFVNSQIKAQLMSAAFALSATSKMSFSETALTTIFLCPPQVHSKKAHSLSSSSSMRASICLQALRAAVATISAILCRANLRSILTTKIILYSSSSSQKSPSSSFYIIYQVCFLDSQLTRQSTISSLVLKRANPQSILSWRKPISISYVFKAQYCS